MLVEKIKNYVTDLVSLIKDTYQDVKYRLKNLPEANEELCYFYIANKNFKDLEYRMKFLKRFFPVYKSYDFFDGVLAFNNKDYDVAAEYFNKFLQAEPKHLLAQHYLELAKSEDKKLKKLPKNLVRFYFETAAGFYNNLLENKNDAYKVQVGNFAELLKFEQKKINVIDLGCGTGKNTQQVYPYLGSDVNLTGVDFAKNMLNEAGRLMKNSKTTLYNKLVNEDIFKFIESAEEKFDIVLLLDTLNYIENPKELLNLLEKITVDSSTIILGFEFDDRKGDMFYSDANLKIIYSRKFIRNIMQSLDYKLVSEPINSTFGINTMVFKKTFSYIPQN